MSNYYDDDGTMIPAREVEPLARELMERRQADWRRKAVEQYPNIQPLADLVQGDSEESVLATARDMSERLSSAGNPGVATPTTYGPPVIGGSPALPPQSNQDEELADAKRRARAGDERAKLEAYRLVRERQAGAR